MVDTARANPAPIQTPIAGDMLCGVKAIAGHLGIKPRQAQHMIDLGRLPHFRVGASICARRSTLNAWLTEQEAKARNAAA